MDKNTILTASRSGPDLAIASPPNNIASRVAPTLATVVRLQHVLSSVSVFLCLRAYFLASATLYAGKIVGWNTYWITKVGAIMSGHLVHGVWESEPIQELRKRMFFEVATFILGCGNGLFLMLFWPGWFVIAGALGAGWWFMG